MTTTTIQWGLEDEITLLHAVLEPIDPFDCPSIADAIICALIEMELVDMDRAPAAQQAWQDNGAAGVSRGFVAKHYRTPDEAIHDDDTDDAT